MSSWGTTIADPYREDRWARRYQPKQKEIVTDKLFSESEEWDRFANFPCDDSTRPGVRPIALTVIIDSSTGALKPVKTVAVDSRAGDTEDKLVSTYLVVERLVNVMPTALLVGMYVAGIFSVFTVGPVWLGFLGGFVPVCGLGAWIATPE